MTKSLSNLLTLILAFVGCGLALLLTVEHFHPIDIGCNKTGEGCATTLSSSYAQIGPVPTTLMGLLMYVAIAALCLLRGKQLQLARAQEAQRAAAYAGAENDPIKTPAAEEATSSFAPRETVAPPLAQDTALTTAGQTVRRLDMAVWGIAALGFGISMWLQYVAIWQLHSFCKYCFTSACLVTLIFALASRDHLLDGRALTGEQKMLGGVLGLIVVLGGFIVFPDILFVITHPNPPPVATPVPVALDKRQALLNPLLHVKGDPNAKYVLVEFADYMCGHCALASKAVEEALQDHPKDLKVAFRNFPLPLPQHRWSSQAAAAAEAAGEQGKFWEMHDLLFERQKELEATAFTDDSFVPFARSLKLDVDKFNADRHADKMMDRIAADKAAGEAGGLQSTPTFFLITPTQISKFAGVEQLKKIMGNPQAKEWK